MQNRYAALALAGALVFTAAALAVAQNAAVPGTPAGAGGGAGRAAARPHHPGIQARHG